MQNDELPDEINAVIQEILESISSGAEPTNFDGHSLPSAVNTAAILNQLFPNEASLAYIDAVNGKLQETQEQLQKEIDDLQLELKRNQDPERMSLIQEMISDLLTQMSRIREKATESEAVVTNITKDIQSLDLAKKNLILSMTTLKRLQMLVNAMAQLEGYIKERRYKEVAESLSAVKEISATFRQYTSVQRISRVWKRIQEIQGELRTQLDADFDAFYLQDPSKQPKPGSISEACIVVDVLGADFRTHLVERFVALELKEYRRIFRTTDEAGQLDNLSRRFAWFKRVIARFEVEQGRVFPLSWKVGWFLLAKFADITRDDLAVLLGKAASALTVKTLLEDLKQTVEFEKSMATKWGTPFIEILKYTSGPNQPQKSISSAFEPHLGIFVDAQDKLLAETLAPHRKAKAGNKAAALPRSSLETATTTRSSTEEKEKDEQPMIVVLPSSTELFYLYGQALEQCAKLSTGQALFELCQLYRKWLRIYAEDVLNPNVGAPTAKQRSAPRKSTESRVDMNEIKQACLVINTADYCQTTAAELEANIKEKIDEEFKEKVTLENERELFVSAKSAAITILLRELENATEPYFALMARANWASQSQVSGPSSYVGDLLRAAEQVVEAVKPLIEQKGYLKNFLGKASNLILLKFTNSLVRSRPLKEIGAEQLLIDLQSVKSCLMKMPGEFVTPLYTKALTKTTTRLESLLKVIVTPLDPKENFVLNYTFLINDSSLNNFQKILDLKGVPRALEEDLEASFMVITSSKNDLDSTSFLSSLDMDPVSSTVGLGAGYPGGALLSPQASRVSLPLNPGSGEGIFHGLSMGSAGPSGPPTGSSTDGASASGPGGRGGNMEGKVFSDIKRLMFGLRKDSVA